MFALKETPSEDVFELFQRVFIQSLVQIYSYNIHKMFRDTHKSDRIAANW